MFQARFNARSNWVFQESNRFFALHVPLSKRLFCFLLGLCFLDSPWMNGIIDASLNVCVVGGFKASRLSTTENVVAVLIVGFYSLFPLIVFPFVISPIKYFYFCCHVSICISRKWARKISSSCYNKRVVIMTITWNRELDSAERVHENETVAFLALSGNYISA